MSELIEICKDVLLDSVKMIPFLFLAFLLIEAAERYSNEKRDRILIKGKKAGPILGALFGVVPQCGFSVIASNLYAEKLISMGTLLAVFMSTSDEALLVMMGYPESGRKILLILLLKIVLAVVIGFLIDRVVKKEIWSPRKEDRKQEKICACCEEKGGIFRAACSHSIKLFIYILLFSLIINILISLIGIVQIQAILMNDSPLQIVLSAAVGLIPNCAASILIAELYMQNLLSLPAVMSGLLASGGVGLFVLWKNNRNRKENLKITILLYASAVSVGLMIQLVLWWIGK